MSLNIFTFLAHIDNNQLSPENFHQGLFNLYKSLVESSTQPLRRRPPVDLVKDRRSLERYPESFRALCFHEIVRAPGGWDRVTKAGFDYDVSVEDETRHAIDPILVAGLKGLAFAADEKAFRVWEAALPIIYRQETTDHVLIAALFSARSFSNIEPVECQPDSRPISSSMAPIIIQEESEATDNPKGPIGVIVEKVFDARLISTQDDVNNDHKRAMRNWLLLLSGDNYKELQPHLSIKQASSLRILLEWWDGAIDFRDSTRRIQNALRQSALTGVHPDDSLLKPDEYQAWMLKLFHWEFLPHISDQWIDQSRTRLRCWAAESAAAQRLAMLVCRSLVTQHSMDPESQLHELLDLGSAVNNALYDGDSLGASISPCAWLPSVNTNDNMPYYLWDIQQRRTVTTRELEGRIEYTAISHTWGRWTKAECPRVQLRGVNGWSIPQNTKFNVADLPDILASASGLKTPFVWFDLLCIPQSPASLELRQVAQDEIARQAKIFRGAKYAIAWVNDVESWTGLHVALRELSVNHLRNQCELPKWMLDLAESEKELEVELNYPKDYFNENPFIGPGEVNAWFSSLWTLQELCLRPDMIFVDRQWRPFSVQDKPVRLDDLAALYGECSLENRSESGHTLSGFFANSGLRAFPNMERGAILTVGNQRVCTENRAEAIMSAVGITDWYSSTLKGNGQDTESESTSRQRQRASYNIYPLDFLREAALKIGPEFYATAIDGNEINIILLDILIPYDPPRDASGTLLPCSTTGSIRVTVPHMGLFSFPHPSVSTWTIQADLSVDIRQAAIIAYTGQLRPGARSGKILADLRAPETGSETSLITKPQWDVDLSYWIDHFLPETRNFAVCLFSGQVKAQGILLKETLTGDLVKVGLFWAKDLDTDSAPIKTYLVDWRVL
ncbi:hypothetical protein BJY01DRAFT_260129 [Aspergillus pseudoustus]|uniref:Heterokaryon incompatibility domain-containing protein n=1 Tax=Aspergillus pseudoustus TaxID=1810923 RepID=A0ABR4KIE0_9EURO